MTASVLPLSQVTRMDSASDQFWCPTRVQHYHDYIQRALPQGAFVTYRRAYIRNISYSLQYMEFTAFQLSNTALHSVVESQLRKTFIIAGCSIIESMLWILLKGNNHQKQDFWEELQCRETNTFSDGPNEFKYEVTHYRKRAAPIDIQMRFIDMCRRAEKKKVLGISSDVYAQIGHLRGLRNRVHIHAVQHDRDNDWWVFRSQDVETMKEVLRAVLNADIFDPFPNYQKLFSWLDASVAVADTEEKAEPSGEPEPPITPNLKS
jgi:hypothetical protein